METLTILALVLDLLILGTLVFAGFKGYKKGFIDVALSLVTIFIVILFTWIFSKPITNMVKENTEIHNEISLKVTSMLDNTLGSDASEVGSKEEVKSKIEGPEFFKNFVANIAEEEKDKGVFHLNAVIADRLADVVVTGIVIIALYFGLQIIMVIIAKLLTSTVNVIPVISGANRITGSIFNVLKTLLIILIILFALGMIQPVIKNESIDVILENSLLIRVMYENNFITKMILK